LASETLISTKYENLYFIKKDGVFHHFIRFQYNGTNYKRKVSIGKSHKDAYRDALALKDKIIKTSDSNKTVTFYMLYRKMVETNKSRMYKRFEKNTNSMYVKHFTSFSNRLIETISLQELQEFINDKIDNYAMATVYQIRRMLIDVYSVSSVQNIAYKIEIPKFDNTVFFDIHIDDARRLYKAILNYPDQIYRSLFLFGIQGRRKAEIAYMRWCDIDIKNKRYYVRPEINKARQHSIYELSDEQIETIKQIPCDREYIHTNEVGKPLYFFSKRWKRLLSDNGIQDMRFHDLRHMLGCLAINEGFSEEYIAKALGHTTTAMVKRYSRMKDSKAYNVTSKLNEILKG